MTIKYFGHSCFLLTSDGGTRVLCDPYDDTVGYKRERVDADCVTISHHHFDHDDLSSVGGNPKVFDGVGEYACGDVKIKGIASYHDNAGGRLRGKNVIYKCEIDGITICHLGDLGEDFSWRLVDEVNPVDVLLIPVGGVYTIDGALAKKYALATSANIIIPMHYRAEGGKIAVDGVDKFLSLCTDQIIATCGQELTLNKSNMVGCKKILVMEMAIK